MAKIIKVDGYWVVLSLKDVEVVTPKNSPKPIEFPTKLTMKVDFADLITDIDTILKVKVSAAYTSRHVFNILAKELCHCNNGMKYAIDSKARFKVRKLFINKNMSKDAR